MSIANDDSPLVGVIKFVCLHVGVITFVRLSIVVAEGGFIWLLQLPKLFAS